jgi:hypothetical protein
MCDFVFFPNVTAENHPPTKWNYLRLIKTVTLCDDPLHDVRVRQTKKKFNGGPSYLDVWSYLYLHDVI